METKFIKSIKYQGVYSRVVAGTNEVMMYIAYKNSNGNYSKYKVGLKSSSLNEKFCYELRQKELTKIRLGSDDPSLANKSKIILFQEIYEDYALDCRNRQCRNHQNAHNKVIKNILPVFGNKNINDITTNQLHEFKLEMLKTLAPSTVRGLIQEMSTTYKYALNVTKKFKGVSPAFKVASSIKVSNARQRYLSKDEIQILLNAYKDYKTPEISNAIILFIKLSLATAGRASTVLAITRRDINKEERTVTLNDFKNDNTYIGHLSKELFPSLDFLDDMKPHHKVLYTDRELSIMPYFTTCNLFIISCLIRG